MRAKIIISARALGNVLPPGSRDLISAIAANAGVKRSDVRDAIPGMVDAKWIRIERDQNDTIIRIYVNDGNLTQTMKEKIAEHSWGSPN